MKVNTMDSRKRKILQLKYAVANREPIKHDSLTINDKRNIKRWMGNSCMICSYDKYLALDHCHSCGIVRGVLCAWCNFIEGHGYSSDNGRERLAFLIKRHPDANYCSMLYSNGFNPPDEWNPASEDLVSYIESHHCAA